MRSLIRRAGTEGLKSFLVALGAPRLLAPVYAGRGAIFVLHRVRTRDPDLRFALNHRNMLHPEAFAQVVEDLLSRGIAIVTLDEALRRLDDPSAGRFACLTFDDGYRDNHEVMLPIVERFGVPVTVYIAPGLIDATAPLWWYALDEVIARMDALHLPLDADGVLPARTAREKQAAFDAAVGFMLRADAAASARVADALGERYGVSFSALAAEHMMDWDAIRALARSPLVEIGAHTLSHPALGRLDPAEALREMTVSATRLRAETGRAVAHFAYPYGTAPIIGPRESALAAEAGFRTAVTAHPGNLFPLHRAHRHALPRHGIAPGEGRAALALKLAGAVRGMGAPWRPAMIRPDVARPRRRAVGSERDGA